jgi:hypothetical protein
MSAKLSPEELLALKNLLEENALEGWQLNEVARRTLNELLSLTGVYDVQYSIVEQKDKISRKSSGSTLIISKIEISNIKCFEKLTIESIPHLQNILYVMLL